MCPNCGHILSFFDMMPILSWGLLCGKCRYCGAKISARYPLVEVLGGIFAVLSLRFYGISIYTILAFALCSVLTCVAFIDHDTMTIPDGLIVAVLILGAVAVFVDDAPWYEHLIGFFMISVFMLVLSLAIPQAFGGGDIKLMAACGLLLGWKNVIFAFFVAILIGGIFAAFKVLRKEKGKKDLISFGPFLCMGVVTAMFVGKIALVYYLSLLGI